MKKFVNKKDEYTSSISEFKKSRWTTKYFYFYCDICKIRHPKKCVNHVYPEEGFKKEADLCYDCQKRLFRKELVDESKFHYF